MRDNECVNMNVLVKEAPLGSDAVNVLEYVFDYVNVSVGGRHSSIVVPLEVFKSPNVSL